MTTTQWRCEMCGTVHNSLTMNVILSRYNINSGGMVQGKANCYVCGSNCDAWTPLN